MTSFSDLGLPPVLEAALARDEITIPTPIQAQAVPILLDGKNAYISSETGTGKTLAYLLPLFTRIDPAQRLLQGIVIVPTHELAMQICEVGRVLAQDAGLAIRFQALIGGTAIKRQLEKLKDKPHIAVGTPGRLKELIDMGKLKSHAVKCVVIDEVDRLLVEESRDAIGRILKSTQAQRQLVFASATRRSQSSAEAEALAPDLVPVHDGSNQVNEAIDHAYIICQERDKTPMLRRLIHALAPQRAIVFLHRNDNTEDLADRLAHHKIEAVGLYRTQDSSQRKNTIDAFRRAAANVLVASDIAARGLDVKGVSHVFNFDLPTQSKDYLHRVGRTSRAGSQGHAISLVTPQELRLVKRYEKELGIVVQAGELEKGVFKV
jgi:superfamily II DNA/RNA helicase